MNNKLYILENQNIENFKDSLTSNLENGNIIFLPELSFNISKEELKFIQESVLDKNHKNISYNIHKNTISGVSTVFKSEASMIKDFLNRYLKYSLNLLHKLFPEYQDGLKAGRTSYRPAQIKTRIRSKRQDDTRLHVDSFASTPVNGNRILRVFCNINPNNEPRVWNIGEPFEVVLNKFQDRIPQYSKFYAKLLKNCKLTKSFRTEYDHIMLNLHDQMKLDDNYQKNVAKTRIEFPPASTWIVYTDQVSHAGLSGQYLLEQTFYLPPEIMKHPENTPYYQIKHILAKDGLSR